MKGFLGNSIYGMGAAAVVSAVTVAPAYAGSFTTCSIDLAAKVTGTAGCQIGSVNNDFLNPLQVNVDGLFGGDWSFIDKDPEDFDITPEGSGGSTSGTWDISAIFEEGYEYMLVFKGGGGNITPNKYVGYLLDAISGEWETPFENANGNLANVSHISLYKRQSDTPDVSVPEPVSVLSLLSVGAVVVTRRKRKGM